MPETPTAEQTPLGEQPIFEVPEEIYLGFTKRSLRWDWKTVRRKSLLN